MRTVSERLSACKHRNGAKLRVRGDGSRPKAANHRPRMIMYALRQPSSFEFGKYGAVVFPSHEDAFNYELLNSLGDHEAQLRRVCERHVPFVRPGAGCRLL